MFAKLKDALIFERQVLVEQKLREIEDETAEEFTSPLQKLKQNMEVRINLAGNVIIFNLYFNIMFVYLFQSMPILVMR